MTTGKKKNSWLKIVSIILSIIVSIIGLAYYLPRLLKGVKTVTKPLSTTDAVQYANNIADDLGTGFNWTADEYDEAAAKKISALSGTNWDKVKLAYKTLFNRDLVIDANNLLDEDIKIKYASFLNPKSIF